MRKQSKQDVEETIDLRSWKYTEAVQALPYLRSIVRSLRDHWLESQRLRLQIRRLDSQSGRPDRQALDLRAEAAREAKLAEDHINEALRELQDLDIHCPNPAKGLALIPFSSGDQQAWFVFDLFAPHALVGWRFHADALETRRMLADKLDPGRVDRAFASNSWFWESLPMRQSTNQE